MAFVLLAGMLFRLVALSQSEYHSDLQRPQNVELLAGMVFRLEALSQSEHRSDLQNVQLIGCWPEWYSGSRSSPSRNFIPTYKAYAHQAVGRNVIPA